MHLLQKLGELRQLGLIELRLLLLVDVQGFNRVVEVVDGIPHPDPYGYLLAGRQQPGGILWIVHCHASGSSL